MLDSPRPWIREGLTGFAQALIRERQAGRRAALAYLGQFGSVLAVAEAQSQNSQPSSLTPGESSSVQPPSIGPQPLINTADDVFFRTKAAYVWWMLRDMVGDRGLQSALARYQPAEDHDTAYMQRLIEKQDGAKRDLEAFFDDWVYRDRGLPQLRVVSAYVRHTLGEQTVTAVTIENLGAAWCEVPVAVRSANGEKTVRLVVPGKSKAMVRVPFEAAPDKAEVNDGSIPEAERRDNVVPVTAMPPVEH
jgi:aminopeptidase N